MFHDIPREYIYFNSTDENWSNREVIQEKIENLKRQILIQSVSITTESIPVQDSSQAASAIKIISQLDDSELLDMIGQRLFDSLNIRMQKELSHMMAEDLDQIIIEAKGYSNLFTTSTPDVQRINEFFTLVAEGLEQAGMLNAEILAALTDLGSQLAGTSLALPVSLDPAMVVNEADIIQARSVIDTLKRAAGRISGGMLSPRSFAQTIDRAFRYGIGDYVAQKLVSNGMKKVSDAADQAFDNLVETTPGLSWSTKPNTTQRYDQYYSQTVMDSPNGITLRVQVNDNLLTVSLAYNGNFKWSTKTGPRAPQTSLLGRFEAEEPFLSFFQPGLERYAVKNISVPHRGNQFKIDPAEGRELARECIAASFFQQWVDRYRKTNPNDLIILTRTKQLVSLDYLLKWAIEDELDSSTANSVNLLNATSSDISNWWRDTRTDPPDEEKAWRRSHATTDALNRIVAACSFNFNML